PSPIERTAEAERLGRAGRPRRRAARGRARARARTPRRSPPRRGRRGRSGRCRARRRPRTRLSRAPGRPRPWASPSGPARSRPSRTALPGPPDRAPDEPLAELLEADPRRRGRLREEARRREPRDRVDLEDEDLPGLVDAQIDARDVL